MAVELEWRRRDDPNASPDRDPSGAGSVGPRSVTSFLDRLGAAIGLAPRVLLRDADADPEFTPDEPGVDAEPRPSSAADPGPGPTRSPDSPDV